MSSPAELFPDGDFRFHLTLRREQPADFFRAQDSSGRLLAERGRWLSLDPDRYARVLPDGQAVVNEFAAWAAEWGTPAVPPTLPASLHDIGRRFEPDLLFLTADPGGQFRLQAGTVCFPSGWSLEEKLGQPLDFIHGVVPGLNATLGNPIHLFLSRLKPGVAFFRVNWGIAATAELNLHPVRGLPPPLPPVTLDRLWLRVEEQVLIALPRTQGIVFGIRIALRRLDDLAQEPEAARGLRRALVTMPAEVAAYKRIDSIRDGLCGLL